MNRIYKIGSLKNFRNHSDHFVNSVEKLTAFDLPVLEFNRCGATENRNGNTQFAALRIDFFDNPILILERAVGDLDGLTNLEADFRFHLFFALFHLREHAVDFGLSHRDRFVFRSGKTNYPWRFANEIPGPANELIVFVEQMHVHDQVTGKELAGRLAFFALLDFRDPLGRNEHFVNQIAHLLGLDSLVDVLLDLVLLAGEHVHHEPLIFACECLCHNQDRAGLAVSTAPSAEIRLSVNFG